MARVSTMGPYWNRLPSPAKTRTGRRNYGRGGGEQPETGTEETRHPFSAFGWLLPQSPIERSTRINCADGVWLRVRLEDACECDLLQAFQFLGVAVFDADV